MVRTAYILVAGEADGSASASRTSALSGRWGGPTVHCLSGRSTHSIGQGQPVWSATAVDYCEAIGRRQLCTASSSAQCCRQCERLPTARETVHSCGGAVLSRTRGYPLAQQGLRLQIVASKAVPDPTVYDIRWQAQWSSRGSDHFLPCPWQALPFAKLRFHFRSLGGHWPGWCAGRSASDARAFRASSVR